MEPLVSVIVLNFNGAMFLEDCLSSLLDQSWAPLEILVVDNGSTDESAEIAGRFPVEWRPLNANHGFAAGNRLGAKFARGEYLVFVNTDMRFGKNFIRKLMGPLQMSSDVFATDARQRDWDDQEDVHTATWIVRRRLFRAPLRGRALPRYELVQHESPAPVLVSQACGGNIAVRRSMWDALDGFDPRLPAGWEDTEICWRAWLRGWKSVYVPDAVCWHHVAGSSASPEGARFRLRGTCLGRLLFSSKHLPAEDVFLAWSAEVLGTFRDLLSGNFVRGRERLGSMTLCVRAFPVWLGERRRLYKAAGTSTRVMVNRMTAIVAGERLE